MQKRKVRKSKSKSYCTGEPFVKPSRKERAAGGSGGSDAGRAGWVRAGGVGVPIDRIWEG